MSDIRDARPIGEPIDDSGGYCCVAAGMHEGHDEDCFEGWKQKWAVLLAEHDRKVAEDVDLILRVAGFDPDEVAKRFREVAMKAVYDAGYRAGQEAAKAREEAFPWFLLREAADFVLRSTLGLTSDQDARNLAYRLELALAASGTAALPPAGMEVE